MVVHQPGVPRRGVRNILSMRVSKSTLFFCKYLKVLHDIFTRNINMKALFWITDQIFFSALNSFYTGWLRRSEI